MTVSLRALLRARNCNWDESSHIDHVAGFGRGGPVGPHIAPACQVFRDRELLLQTSWFINDPKRHLKSTTMR
jgi:hypothetical protein